MTKEHLVERYGTLRYTIGTGCSGGSLAQQWIANAYPGRLPGDPADLLVPGRLGHGDAVPRLPPHAGLLRRPVEVGGRRRVDARRRWRPSRATSRSRTPQVSDVGAVPRRRPHRPAAAGITDAGALRPGHQPRRRAVHDPGRGHQRVRPAPARRLVRRRSRRSGAASRASRPTTSACSTASARCAAARSRRPSSSTSTPRSAASTSSTARSCPSRHRGRPGRRWPTPIAAA